MECALELHDPMKRSKADYNSYRLLEAKGLVITRVLKPEPTPEGDEILQLLTDVLNQQVPCD